MSEISIYRALFPRQKLFTIINYYYSQSVTPCPVLISVTLPCFACFIRGVLFKSTILRVQLLRRNPSIYPAALLHPLTWLFGLKEAIVSTSFILLSPFWFLNWKSTLVPPSVTQKPIVCLIRYHPALQISDLEGTYKHPCASRPLYKRIIFFYIFFFTTFLCENTPLYPSFALLSPCVAKRF